ncbi:hypothetical protein BDP27DRAFT_1356266 [Rhodocollybia butyracea]|uniref:Transmembrane protein 188 n=1 Tax=Rhodocollybia butyracea TaxID=206335 RepID=A0A9P5UH17_9AGAR|nr:hypothetical protein BDP27DRAFT_1356266 [Rhodocollybia butyracea]
MPPRSTPPSSSSKSSSSTSSSSSLSSSPATFFFPPNDSTTYRDLLLFEERLKSTAASLQQRKQRYQLFLLQLLTVISFLLYEVLVSPEASLLAIPYTWFLQQLRILPSHLPQLYPDDSEEWQSMQVTDTKATIHPYITTGLLFVSVTTLVLFFASGMYSEKIAYANKYVPHANKALRSLNIYLNVRRPPLRSKFQFRSWNPLSFFFPRPQQNTSPDHSPSPSVSTLRSSSRSTTSSGTGTPRSSRSPSPNPDNPGRGPRTSGRNNKTSTMIPISPIPPSSNPRGELIFSSRIDRSFRESYERYRAAFERRREEREREMRNARWRHKIWGWVLFWRKPEPEPKHTRTVSLLRGSSTSSASGRTTPASRTPPPSPKPESGRHSRERSVSPSRDRDSSVVTRSMRAVALERSANENRLV